MLAKNRRLTRRLVEGVLKKGKMVSLGSAAVKSLSLERLGLGPGGAPSRFAFLVSGKEVKLAADRNRLRRRARAIIRSHHRLIKDNYGIVLILRHGLVSPSFAELSRIILLLLKKARLIT